MSHKLTLENTGKRRWLRGWGVAGHLAWVPLVLPEPPLEKKKLSSQHKFIKELENEKVTLIPDAFKLNCIFLHQNIS